MFPCSLLPTSLLALLFTFPVLSAPSSPNDPFREIALRVPKQPEPPVCCLRPLEPLEPTTEEEVLLSFEEWKAKRLSEAKDHAPETHVPAGNAHRPRGSGGIPERTSEPTSTDTTTAPSHAQDPGLYGVPQDGVGSNQLNERLSPHFRIPIVDRFNYASMDCSARVHTAQRSAKSPSSILSSKKDRYMLSPCGDKQFVIVELCEDIRIDTVQLANFEFFSGVFKDFTVSVAKRYTTNVDDWTIAGTYRARNVRGVQSFHPPTSLRDFYRFIRIDFHSHYGTEYYCPVSLLRVYGLTHLEQWKWDMWEAEDRARRSTEESSLPLEAVAESPQTVHVPVADNSHEFLKAVEKQSSAGDTASSRLDPSTSELSFSKPQNTVSDFTDPVISQGTTVSSAQSITKSSHEPASSVHAEPQDTATVKTIQAGTRDAEVNASTTSHDGSSSNSISSHDGQSQHSTTSSHSIATTTTYAPSFTPSTQSSTTSSEHDSPTFSEPEFSDTFNTNNTLSTHSTRSSSSSSSIPNQSSSSITTTVSSHPLPPPPPLAPVTTGGESIYRTIMNRLTALEGNTTLYTRYVEEQIAGVREMLRRLGEDVGRLEGIERVQSQMYQRSISEFEKQRRRLEIEHIELLSKVNRLADEIVLEKRLGIAQLCLLLAVLVFMTLTRGSRGEHVHSIAGLGRQSMRDWGRRTLSFSGDWVSRFRSRSPTPQPVIAAGRGSEKNIDKVEFPSQALQPTEGPSRIKSAYPSSASKKIGSRPRTPSSLRVSTSRHHHVYNRPLTHGGTFSTPSAMSRPPIQRSNSGDITPGFGGVGPVPRSAKRLARSAHLHEVKSTSAVFGADNMDGNTAVYSQWDGKSQKSRGVTSADLKLDMFSPQSYTVTSDTLGKGKERLRYSESRPPLSSLRLASAKELPMGCVRGGPTSEADASEGDGWVDTDADGSGSESAQGQDGEFQEDTLTPVNRTQAADDSRLAIISVTTTP
ncbi:hypothetical protein AcW1_007221 [Taiwanofungus camphoratus]|nr:hypothetical protein AcV7_004932 [Antrodia cinnamomea]KAI0952852.1 hypothetical protein AcW1_007221 [Antrodia cinnamomea]